MYIFQADDKQQIVVLRKVIYYVFKENHNLEHVAHPDIRRTCDLISLKFGGLACDYQLWIILKNVTIGKDERKTVNTELLLET